MLAYSKLQTSEFEAEKYGYEGAHEGILNYTITTLIQRVPACKVERGEWKEEFRYWIYATTVSALMQTAFWYLSHHDPFVIGGVFVDIKDEYKRRVNTAYEAAQIAKSGDCYDAPYYTRLVEVVDHNGNHVGYQEVMLKRDANTLNIDILSGKIVLRPQRQLVP